MVLHSLFVARLREDYSMCNSFLFYFHFLGDGQDPLGGERDPLVVR